jgi:hypothetical protein
VYAIYTNILAVVTTFPAYKLSHTRSTRYSSLVGNHCSCPKGIIHGSVAHAVNVAIVAKSRLFDRSSAGILGFANANMNPLERGFAVSLKCSKMFGRFASSSFGLLLGLGSLCGGGGMFGSCVGGLPLGRRKRRAVVVKHLRNIFGGVRVVDPWVSEVCVVWFNGETVN